MVITMESRSYNQLELREYNDRVRLSFDGQVVFEVQDGEPEDNYLHRNFNPVYILPELLKAVHAAGKRGEDLDIQIKDIEE